MVWKLEDTKKLVQVNMEKNDENTYKAYIVDATEKKIHFDYELILDSSLYLTAHSLSIYSNKINPNSMLQAGIVSGNGVYYFSFHITSRNMNKTYYFQDDFPAQYHNGCNLFPNWPLTPLSSVERHFVYHFADLSSSVPSAKLSIDSCIDELTRNSSSPFETGQILEFKKK